MPRKPIDQSIVEGRVSAISGGNIRVVGLYMAASGPIRCQCVPCGHEWSPPVGKVMRGTGCPRCNILSMTAGEEKFRARLAQVGNPLVEPLEPYKGAHHKIRCRCKSCGNEWLVTPNSLLRQRSGCPACCPTGGRRDPDVVLAKIRQIHGEAIEILGPYQGTSKPILCRCKVCDFEWKPTPHTLRRGHGCRNCAGFFVSENQFVDRLTILFGGTIRLIGPYTGMQKPNSVQCLVCGFEWAPYGTNLYHQESGCPTCAPNGFHPSRPATFYYFRLSHEAGPLYKIGITGRTKVEKRYLTNELNRMTLIGTRKFDRGTEAKAYETSLKRRYRDARFLGTTGFSFGCTEVFVRDILGWDSYRPA